MRGKRGPQVGMAARELELLLDLFGVTERWNADGRILVAEPTQTWARRHRGPYDLVFGHRHDGKVDSGPGVGAVLVDHPAESVQRRLSEHVRSKGLARERCRNDAPSRPQIPLGISRVVTPTTAST